MTGQTNLFDDVMEQDERFVIVVQSIYDTHAQLVKKTLREYTSLTREQMQSLFNHLKDLYLNEPFEENQAFLILLFIRTKTMQRTKFMRILREKIQP